MARGVLPTGAARRRLGATASGAREARPPAVRGDAPTTPPMTRLVAVTGPIASGATTLARRLSEINRWKPVFERDVERNNAFFARGHADPARWGFHNQVAFLTDSAELHAQVRAAPSDAGVHVQDYTPFEHTEVYAEVRAAAGELAPAELALLKRLAAALEPAFVVPAVLVYRPMGDSELTARVEGRGRPSEQQLPRDYLAAVRARFDRWAADWTRCPIVRVPADLDVVIDDAGVRAVALEVGRHLAPRA